MKKDDNRKLLETKGWLLFAGGSSIYLIDSILNKNFLGVIGSVAFIVGCVFFILAEKS